MQNEYSPPHPSPASSIDRSIDWIDWTSSICDVPQIDYKVFIKSLLVQFTTPVEPGICNKLPSTLKPLQPGTENYSQV